MRRRRLGLSLVLLVVVLVHVPSLSNPFARDDLNCIREAERTRERPSNLSRHWMGGTAPHEHWISSVTRIFPKLYFVGAARAFGAVPWPYRLVNLFLHLAAVVLVHALLVPRASPRAALVAAALFGVGLGAVTKGVMHVANVTMLSGLALFLASVALLSRGRRAGAATLYVASIACHEIFLVGLALVPFVAKGPPGLVRRRGALVLAGGALVAFGALVEPGTPGDLARREIEQLAFLAVPVNPARSASVDATALPPALRRLATPLDVAARNRGTVGLAVLALLVVVAVRWCPPRAERLPALAAAWVLVFLAPTAWLMTAHPELGPAWAEGWLQRRYLHVPGIGAAVLLALGIERARDRARRLGILILVAVVLWILAMDAIVLASERSRPRPPLLLLRTEEPSSDRAFRVVDEA